MDAFSVALNQPGNTGGSVSVPYSWAQSGADGLLTISGTVPAGGFVTVPVVLTLRSDFDTRSGENAYNYVEITADDGDDVDSTLRVKRLQVRVRGTPMFWSTIRPTTPTATRTTTMWPGLTWMPAWSTTMTWRFSKPRRQWSGTRSCGHLHHHRVQPGRRGCLAYQLVDVVSQAHPSLPVTQFPQWDAFQAALNPAGTTGGSVNLAYSWAATGNDGLLTITGTLPAGGFVTVPVVLTLRDDFDTEANENAYNYVEILADDGDDVDSTPESETPAGPGSGNTDTLVDNVVDNSSNDEDDHDVAGVDVMAGTTPTFDLALRKTHVSGNAVAGELVTFLIEIINQGTIDAEDIEIIDYVDVAHPDQSLGFDQWEAFNIGDNPNGITGGVGLPYVWSAAGVATISGTLPAGQSLTIPVTLQVSATVPAGSTLFNWAEINDAGNATSTPDSDSQPESSEGDGNTDVLVDDVVTNAGGDEDDHDVATVGGGSLYAIPTLGEWSLILLSLMLLGIGMRRLRP